MHQPFNQLAQFRAEWIRQGHKNVPDPLCCCGFEKRTSRSLASGYQCPLHAGILYACYRYLLAFLLVVSPYLWLLSGLCIRGARRLERHYHAKKEKASC